MVFVPTAEGTDAEGTPNTVVGVIVKMGPLVTREGKDPGGIPTPEVSQVDPVVIEPVMGPDPVPVPSGVSSVNPFLST